MGTEAPSTRTRVNIFTCEYFYGFKNYRVHTLPFSYRFRLSTRTRVNLKTMMKYINLHVTMVFCLMTFTSCNCKLESTGGVKR